MPVLTDQQVSDYHRDGFVVVPKLLDDEEIDIAVVVVVAARRAATDLLVG